MKRIIFISILSLAFASGAYSQFYYGGIYGYYSFPRTEYVIDSAGNIRFKPHDMGFNMQVGAGAGSNFHGNSWFGTSVSPSFAYNVSGRFRLSAGVSISRGFGGNYYPGYDSFYSPMSTNATTTSVFVKGDYILNNKLMISGAAYKYFSPLNSGINDPRYKSPEGEGVMFNINYRPIRNLEINASFEYGNGTGNYRHDPFYHPAFSPY
jgi:hypothetical protein